MKRPQPLKAILSSTRAQWNSSDTRTAVRENFEKMIQCGTEALGGEVYASDVEEKIVWHTCKSRACPSCGHRATRGWLMEQANALPDVPFVMVTLTMPDLLWPLFQQNRHLLVDLPALGAAVIQSLVRVRYGMRPMIIVIPHTFGHALNFNCHLHVLLSCGGLDISSTRWIDAAPLGRDTVMRSWRNTLITYLQKAWRADLINQGSRVDDIPSLLESQSSRWWNVHITGLRSKKQLIRYAGRYLRRPPIAQHRLSSVSDKNVVFRSKVRRLKRSVLISMPLAEFVHRLADHVPERYRHAVRYFGLLAPSTRAKTAVGLFNLLGQRPRRPLRKLGWAASIRADFGKDPLRDSHNNLMRWKRRIAPSADSPSLVERRKCFSLYVTRKTT
jgi:hypothetical protein